MQWEQESSSTLVGHGKQPLAVPTLKILQTELHKTVASLWEDIGIQLDIDDACAAGSGESMFIRAEIHAIIQFAFDQGWLRYSRPWVNIISTNVGGYFSIIIHMIAMHGVAHYRFLPQTDNYCQPVRGRIWPFLLLTADTYFLIIVSYNNNYYHAIT